MLRSEVLQPVVLQPVLLQPVVLLHAMLQLGVLQPVMLQIGVLQRVMLQTGVLQPVMLQLGVVLPVVPTTGHHARTTTLNHGTQHTAGSGGLATGQCGSGPLPATPQWCKQALLTNLNSHKNVHI